MKIKISATLLIFFAFYSFISAQNTFRIRKEYKSECTGTSKVLIETQEFNSAGKIIKSIKENKKTTTFEYDSNNNLISKTHRDSSNKITRYNKIYYNATDGSSIDTLFNSDASIHTIFHRRHSKNKNEDIITWDLPQYKGSTIIQTIKLDENKNELENKLCSSSAECTTTINTFEGNQLVKSESYRKEEMYRIPILYETQTFEYNNSGRLSKTTVQNNLSNSCSFILEYSYE